MSLRPHRQPVATTRKSSTYTSQDVHTEIGSSVITASSTEIALLCTITCAPPMSEQ